MSGLERLSLLGRLSAAVQRLVFKRNLMGLDEHGNRYFMCAAAFPLAWHLSDLTHNTASCCRKIDQHPNGNGALERRWMRTPDGGYDPDKAGLHASGLLACRKLTADQAACSCLQSGLTGCARQGKSRQPWRRCPGWSLPVRSMPKSSCVAQRVFV